MKFDMNELRKELDEYSILCSLAGEEPDGTPADIAAADRIQKEITVAEQMPLLDQMRFLGFKSQEEAQFIHLVDMHMVGLGFKRVYFDHPPIPDGQKYLYIKWVPANEHFYTVVYRHYIGSEHQGDWFIMYGHEPIRHVDCGNLWKNMEAAYTAFPPTSKSDKG